MPAIGDTASRSELMQLRKELADLRKAAGLPAPVVDQPHKEVYASATLIESMDRLHGVLDKLVSLFENANKEVYHEYNKGLQDTDEKLNRLIAQNEKIARGVVALADVVAQKREPAPVSVVPIAPKTIAAPVAAPLDTDDVPIPPPPRFNPSAPDNGTAGWQPAVPAAQSSPRVQNEEESFLRQPITTISATPPARVALPPITQSLLPPLTPPAQVAPAPITSPSPAELPPSLPALAPLKLSGSDLPPPPPPPAASRRNLLDKFAFK